MLYGAVTEFTTSPTAVSPHYLLKLKPHKRCILKLIIAQQKNESTCEISEQFFIRRVQNVRLVKKFI